MSAPTSDSIDGARLLPQSPRRARSTSRFVPLAAITLVALFLRLAWAVHADPVPVSDFHDYWTLARGLVDHRQFGYPEPTAFFLPMHPLVLAAFVAISDSPEFVRLATVLISSATVIPAYFVGLNVVGSRRGALIAAAGFAMFPTFVLFSPVLATEHLFVLLMLGAAASATMRRGFLVTVLCTGILLGLATLTRGEGAFYIPAFLLWLGFGLPDLPVRRRLLWIAALLVAVTVTLTPWWVRNSVVVDPAVGLSSSSGLNFYFAHNDSGNYGDFIEGNPLYGLPSAEASSLGWELGLAHIRNNPLSLAEDVWLGTRRLFGAPDYAVFWSTQVKTGDGANDFVGGYVFGARTLGELAAVATIALFALSAASLFFARSWCRAFTLLVVPLIASSWALRTVIYWAKPRYGYFVTAMCILAASITIDRMAALVTRSSRESNDVGSTALP